MQDLKVEEIITKRAENLFNFAKNKSKWLIYACLVVVIYLAVWIRTRNLPGLRDVTTGGWTLGPDLDPFLFLRYAKYIVENGSLFAIDHMRYVPLGIGTGDFPLHYYSIAWFHKIAGIFGSGSVEQSAVIFPVFMFALTTIAFFLMSRKVLKVYFDRNYASIGALISTLFFSLLPIFIPRTIAGIPEKEASAFFFMFLAFYFLMEAWDKNSNSKRIIFGLLAGISTGLMALIWGAYAYIFFMIIPAVFVAFLFNNFGKEQIISYSAWITSAIIIMIYFSDRYELNTIFTSLDRGLSIAILFAVCIYQFWYSPKIEKKISNIPYLNRLPPKIVWALIFLAILFLLAFIIIGPKFVIGRLDNIYTSFVKPAPSRLIQTVAENRQPYLTEWMGNFGPGIKNIFVSFWLFLIGSVVMFWKSFSKIGRKDRAILTTSFGLMIFLVIFTRYSPNSIFNGQSFISLLFYGGGILAFLISFIGIYSKYSKNNELHKFDSLKIEALIFFSFLFMSLISARGFIRLVMIVVIPMSISMGYLGASSLYTLREKFRDKEKYVSIIIAVLVILLLIFAGYNFFLDSRAMASSYVPSAYTQQWQKAMGWVRDNTHTSAVFGHWWDYGYWVQTMGERATALDGGNSIAYWNHLMGRYALTETNFEKTIAFLYAHNVSHFLIDSTDIGKYSAFSTIGSDETYDRRSWIPTLLRDNSQTTEKKSTTLFVYPGGTALDQDIRYVMNGTELFFPEGRAYVAAIVISVNNDNNQISEVYGVYYLNEKTYQIPIRYYIESGENIVDTGKGIDAGVFIYPRVVQNSAGGGDVEPRGAVLYLSSKIVHNNLAKYYLFGEENDNFKVVHSESDAIVSILTSQGISVGDFIYFNEFRGPIKIWEIKYPRNMEVDQFYLETEYPDSIRLA